MGAVGDKWAGAGAKGATKESIFLNTVGHAAVGCGSSAASGGSCKSGAMSGGLSAAWGNYGPSYEAVNGDTGILIKNTVIAATVGGAGSVIGGGKFWNGAETGAFGYLFNFAAHEGKDFLLNGKESPIRILWEGSEELGREYSPVLLSIAEIGADAIAICGIFRPYCRTADGFISTGKVVNGLANGDNSELIANGSGEGASRIQKAVLTTANIQNIPRILVSGAVIDSWSYVTSKLVEFRVGLEQKPKPEPEPEPKK